MEQDALFALLAKNPALMASVQNLVKKAEDTTNASPPQPRGRSPTPRQLGADQDGATSTTAGKEPASPQSRSPRKSRSPRQSKSQSRSRSRSRSQPKSKSRSRSQSESPPPRSPTRKKNDNRPSKSPPRRSDEEDSDGAKAPSPSAKPSLHYSTLRRLW